MTDYFAVLGLEPRLSLDAAELEARFYSRSRELHPDRNRAPGAQVAAAELNDAYRTLRDPVSRAEYLLGRLGENGVDTGRPPTELLEEVFEWNMALEAADEAQIEELRRRFSEQVAGLDRELEALFAAYDSGQAVLPPIRELLQRRRYLWKLLGAAEETR